MNILRRLQFHGGIVLGVVLCVWPTLSVAQFRPPNHHDNPLPGGHVSSHDPTDPANRSKAAQKRAGRFLKEGQRLLSKGKILRAKTKFKAAIGLVGLTGAGQAALHQLEDLQRRGMKSLQKARDLYKKDQYRQALDLAKETKVRFANLFGGLPMVVDAPRIARLSKKLIKQIESDPQAQIQFQEEKAGRRAKKIAHLEKLVKKDPSRYLDLYKTLKVLSKRFPDSPTGKRCHQRWQELKTDRRIWTDIRHERRRRFIASTLTSVEQYEKAGLMTKAAKEYHKLEDRYPGKSREELQRISQKKH